MLLLTMHNPELIPKDPARQLMQDGEKLSDMLQ